MSALGAAQDFLTIPAARNPRGGQVACDLLDRDSVRACLRDSRPDLIINAAGSASVAAGFEDPASSQAINATAVGTLLEVAAEECPDAHLVLLSSAQVYGEAGDDGLPFVESAPIQPITPYGEAKAEMEELARAAGARVTVARLFNQLGPGLPPEQGASGFAARIAAAEASGAGRAELLLGNPEAARDFTDIRDTAGALLDLAERRSGGTFNVCSGVAVPIRALIDALAAASTVEVDVAHDPGARPGAEPSVSYGDPSRLRDALGWEPAIPLEASLSDLLGWWRVRESQ